jgi:WD40 repeat protein
VVAWLQSRTSPVRVRMRVRVRLVRSDGAELIRLLRDGDPDGPAQLTLDAHTGAPFSTLTGHTGYVYAVVFSPDGTRLATTSNDRTARPWDPPQWES